MSSGRPIHTPPRDLRDTPDEAEPSYSYEDSAFVGGVEDDVEDEFHRRLASNTRRENSGGGGPTSSTTSPGTIGGGGGGGGGSGSLNGGVGSSVGGGSFWRTDMPVTALPTQPVTLKERKSSGGLLGAALQLHSQSSNVSDGGPTATSNANGKKDKSSAKKSADNGDISAAMVRTREQERIYLV
jgi:hypothetical protein